MSIIEACARSGAITILLLLAALVLRDGRAIAAGRYAALFALSVAATLVTFAPALATDRALWLFPERVLAFGASAVFWVVSAAMFDDEFRLSWPHAVAWSGLVALGFWAVYGDAGSRPFLPMNVLSLTCLLLAVRSALAGRDADLVEAPFPARNRNSKPAPADDGVISNHPVGRRPASSAMSLDGSRGALDPAAIDEVP